MIFHIEKFDSIDSTNTYLYNAGLNNAKEGTVVTASSQSKGKGRCGREFHSPFGNLYMSILIRPNVSAQSLRLLTPMCAVAVYDAIYDVLGIKCSIKWVNDLYYNNKKVCGILTELNLKDNLVDFAVVGIGINVFPCDFSADIKDIAGTIITDNIYNEAQKEEIIDKLINSILEHFDEYYKEYNMARYLESYRSNSMVIGKKVYYETAAGRELIEVLDISDEGELIVKNDRDEVKKFYDGEIRIKI